MSQPQPPSAPVPLEQTRQAVIQQLCQHFAVDNLTSEALEGRLDRAHAAATLEELRTLVADLPAVPSDAAVAPRSYATPAGVAERQVVLAVMSGTTRKGVWTPARSMHVIAIMGGVDLDFREARIPPGVTEVNVFALMGGVEIVVPPHVCVDASGFALMGAFEQVGRTDPPADPNAPVLRINGFAMMGGVEVSVRLPGERARDARRREREEQKRLGRG